MIDLKKPIRTKLNQYPARYVATLEGRNGIIMAFQIPDRDGSKKWTARNYVDMTDVDRWYENVPPPKVKMTMNVLRYYLGQTLHYMAVPTEDFYKYPPSLYVRCGSVIVEVDVDEEAKA